MRTDTAAQGPAESAEPERDVENPRNFTWTEFRRGVFIAWGVYQPIGILVLALSMVCSSTPPGQALATAACLWAIGGVIASAAVTLFTVPGAYGLGLLLRRVRRDAIHLVAFLVYGCAIGFALFWGLAALSGDASAVLNPSWWTDGLALGAGIAVALGSLITSRIALAEDRKLAAEATSSV